MSQVGLGQGGNWTRGCLAESYRRLREGRKSQAPFAICDRINFPPPSSTHPPHSTLHLSTLSSLHPRSGPLRLRTLITRLGTPIGFRHVTGCNLHEKVPKKYQTPVQWGKQQWPIVAIHLCHSLGEKGRHSGGPPTGIPLPFPSLLFPPLPAD